MAIEGWFPTPIYYTTVTDIFNIQTEMNIAYNKIQENKKFNRPDWFSKTCQSVSDPTFVENAVETYNLDAFNKELNTHIREYTNALIPDLNLPYKVAASWFTKTEKGEYAMQHAHGHYDISGVYYFKTNGEDGFLKFINPTQTHLNTIFLPGSSRSVVYQPRVGRLLLWPSWLEHRVTENQTNNTRISFSFNILFNRF